MKIIPAVVCFLLVGLSAVAAADEVTPEPAQARNGVFFTYTGYMTTVLELKDGRFRYWFESDAKMMEEPAYPLTGEYSVSGDTITLKHEKVGQKQWAFRTLDGVVTLWRPDAIAQNKVTQATLEYLKRFGGGSILILTGKPADELWKHRGPPSQ